MPVTTGTDPVGREAELTLLRDFGSDVAGGPCGIVIRGEAGIGKSLLWRAALHAAARAGVRVLATRSVEAEMPLPLGGLGDLIQAGVLDVESDLARRQRATLAIAAGLEAPGEERHDQLALPRAFTSYLRALARRAPVVVAVDDVQWLDRHSVRVLAFAARRLGDAPLGVLVTQRGDAADPLDLAHALEERFHELRLGPLSVGALHQLVRTRLGLRVGRPQIERVHAASGGNPMFALEFTRAAAARGGSLSAPLPVPPSLEHLVQDRIGALPQRLRALLAAVAAVDRPTPSVLGDAVDGAEQLLDEACETGVLSIGDDQVVRFDHPLLAAAAYASLPPARKARLHADLAAASDDPVELARHLALSSREPSDETAGALDEAAAALRARGAPDAAAELARHAARLTPQDDRAGAEERILAAAAYLIEAGRLADAVVALDELLATGIAGPRRARALMLRAFPELDGETAMQLGREAVEHAGDDLELGSEVLLFLSAGTVLVEGDVAAAEELAGRALAIVERIGDSRAQSQALDMIARLAVIEGRPDPTLSERAIRLAATSGSGRWTSLETGKAEQLLWAGDLDGARALLEGLLDTRASEGILFGRMRLLRDLADLEWRAGNWERAERHLDEHWELTFDGGDRFHELVARPQQALLAASRGRVDDARRFGLEALEHAETRHWLWHVPQARWALGFLALSLDEPAEACKALAGVPDLLDRLRVGEPGLWPVLPDVVEAFAGAGRVDDAEQVAVVLDRQACALRHRWATPAAWRCRALVLLARGESAAAFAAADDAASAFESAGFALDRGRALLLAGVALRRLGERRRAAAKLEDANVVFSELGAPLWHARAEQELQRASPRPRRDHDLTSAERRVAALVAEGRTNREVAAQLFTTVGTVEVHLTRIYRKLDLRSRTELARRVAEGVIDLATE